MAWSRHSGFFASLRRVEDRLALEEEEEQGQSTGSSLVLLDHPPAAAADSSGPALDFLTLTRHDDERTHSQEKETEEEEEEDDDLIERLMALLGGLSPPHGEGGCDCSGGGGFMAKVVGVVGPKCDGERRRLDAWIHHFYSDGCREPARLAHLLLAKFSDGQAALFPATINAFLDRDAPSTH